MNCSIFSVRRFDYPKPNYSKYHKHRFYEFNCYMSGKGFTHIDGKEYSFSPHSFAIIPPNILHDEYYSAPGEVICILFEADSLPFNCPKSLIVPSNESLIFTYAPIMYKESTEKRNYFNSVNNNLLKNFILEVQRILEKDSDPIYKTLFDIKNYISENFYKKISFSDIANSSGYSYDYFRHIFKEKYGISPQTFLINTRLENAHSILSSTPDISITEVSESCGFSDSSQFSTMFTKFYGISPKKFQKSEEKKILY